MTFEKKGQSVRGKVQGESHKKRQKFKKLNWRPSLKQRGLFSDRDPSQETQLENRLNRLSKLLADIAQHVRKRHVNKVCYAGLLPSSCVWVCLLDILQAGGEALVIVLGHFALFQMILTAGSKFSSFGNKGRFCFGIITIKFLFKYLYLTG